jgi:hypothetical protein
MFKVISKQTRSNSSVQFYDSLDDSDESAEFRLQWLVSYIDTGKVLSIQRTLSPDLLELTTTIAWKDEQSHLDSFSDPIFRAMIERRNEYNLQNNITVQLEKYQHISETNSFSLVPNKG